MHTVTRWVPPRKMPILGCIVALSIALSGCGGGDGGNTPLDAVSAALSSGDASKLSTTQIMSELQSRIAPTQGRYLQTKKMLQTNIGNGGISWNPGQESAYWSVLDRLQNQPILTGNWRYIAPGNEFADPTGETLAVVGVHPAAGSRYAAFSGNTLGVPGNEGMDTFMYNTVLSLLPNAVSTPPRVVVAHFPEGGYFPHEQKVRAWLVRYFPGLSINGVKKSPETQPNSICDGANLAACLAQADLLIIGREDPKNESTQALQAVRSFLARGLPVLYLHHDYTNNALSRGILDEFHLGLNSNFWWKYGVKGVQPKDLPVLPNDLEGTRKLLAHLDRKDFSTTWTGCTTTSRFNCDGDAAHMNEFFNPANVIRKSLRFLEEMGIAIFSSPGYEIEKLLILLSDKYRQETSYYDPPAAPKPGTTYYLKKENTQAFYRAYFSDIGYYSLRPYATVARDLGSFANPIPPSVIGQTQTVAVDLPTKGTRDYMTGLYVMPGRTISLTRTDSGTGKVRFGVNMLRDSTWVYNQLDRPTLLSSPRPELKAGQTLTITNPYGGPLFLFVDAASTQQPKVSVQVSGVTVHPVLRDATDRGVVDRFVQDVNTTPASWIGITTDMLTIHSTRKHFLESINLYKDKGGIQQLVSDTWTYTIKDTYELAGFNTTPGKLILDAKVQAFCENKGWDCTGIQHQRDVMQHVISDARAACGAGCSGNPFDESWAFDPLGWGESHEIGHNIQLGRISIYNESGSTGEVSNNIFPVHKHIHYNEVQKNNVFVDRSEIGNDQPTICSNPKQSVAACEFLVLKNALGQNDPITTAKNAIWFGKSGNNSERLLFYRQWVEYARAYNPDLGDGWALITLMYLLDRNLSKAAWANSWGGLDQRVFSKLTLESASKLSSNDFSLIASSYIIGKDMRPMFDLWGITYTSEASAQVDSYQYEKVKKLLFPMASLSVRGVDVGTPIEVPNTAIYPQGY